METTPPSLTFDRVCQFLVGQGGSGGVLGVDGILRQLFRQTTGTAQVLREF